MMKVPSTAISRRTVMQGAAVAGVVAGIPGLAGASAIEASGDSIGATARDRAGRLLATLGPDQLQAALFPFDGVTRRGWNYMGAAAKPGLRLEQMSQSQKDMALDLLSTFLGSVGIEKSLNIMYLQDVLRDLGRGPSSRNRERFSVAVFGLPSASRPWGWRFEGHHLTLSFTMAEDRVVSVTPSSFSSNPNTVSNGPHRGLVALDAEEHVARQLFNDLTPAHQDRARIGDRAVGNILTTAGREGRFTTREGLPAAEMTAAQQDLMMRLIDTYAVDHLAEPLAGVQAARVRSGDPAAIHFAWAGGSEVGERYYYRLHGDTFVIEFASLRDPLHVHTIRHDTEWNLGDHVARS